ncbi:MAG TPA: ABC transporter substrate-binding protein [Dehalococcoidia bacterium]|nr:ABC transporter substrate-binding protein [Dehalococcoidia bacterium]
MLASTGGAAAGALILAACGGGDDGKEQPGSSLLTKPVDTSNKAVPGSVWKSFVTADVTTLDPHANSSGGGFNQMSPSYDNLVRYDRGSGGNDGQIIGDAAESWEFSPDGLTLTLKLRNNLKFDPRPPTSGRVMTSADVKFSFDRTLAKSPYAADWINSKNAEAPVTSVATPDDRTVSLKLKYPYLSMMQILAHNTYFYVLPQEADGKFDPRSEVRGSGPFFLDKWTPSAGFEFKKNPEWIEKDKKRPFLDGISQAIVSDYAAGLAQFETGNIWDFNVKPDDILRTKTNHPQMVMRQSYVTGTGGRGHIIVLSQQPDSPMRDVRVRRAASMLINRQAWIETMYGTEKFKTAGLPIDVRWNSHIPGYMPEWLNPQGKDLGEGAKYFQFDVAEAKKLLAAAGYTGKDKLSHFYSTNAADYTPYNTVLNGMFAEGLTTDFRPLDYNTEWRQVCQQSLGTGYNGFCYLPVSGFNAENYLQTKYTPEGKAAISGQPISGLTDLVRKIKTETDANKQQELIKQAQRDAANQMPDIVLPGFSYGFQLSQPWLENYGVFSGSWLSARLYLDYWYNAERRS